MNEDITKKRAIFEGGKQEVKMKLKQEVDNISLNEAFFDEKVF